MSQVKAEFDTPWKDILDIYFEDFIAYCWPERYPDIDWKKGYKRLDKELSKITRNAPIGNRIVDKLIEVFCKSGVKAWILIHVEVQGSFDPNFGERMLVYHYRLRDLYQKPIASLAVLIDNNPWWKPNNYKEEFWESSLEIQFNVVKLIDYKNCIEELKRSKNRFAPVILAQLAALEQEGPRERLMNKIRLTKDLYTSGLQKDDILELYRFIDWIIALPQPLELEYHKELDNIEGEFNMAYISTAERMGMKKIFLAQLEYKFLTVPEEYRQQIELANQDRLFKLMTRVLDTSTLEEVFEV